MTPSLLGIHYSPWSQKARRALTAAGVEYRYTEYLPVFGEPQLRLKLKQFGGRVSVPILFVGSGDEQVVLRDSFDIAQFAATRDVRLIPAGSESVVAAFNTQSERLLALGRERTTASVKADPAALLENLPRAMRKLGPVSKGLGAFGARFLQKKYDMVEGAGAFEAHERDMRSLLDSLADALGTKNHLVGDHLSYADITMAVGLTFVKPHESVRIGRRSRPHWCVDSLVGDFGALLEWRDRIYASAPP